MIAHVLIHGFVQGVGFRQSVKKEARKLGLTGWVKNLPDGRVEAVFSGPKDKIEEAVNFCRKGPFLSEVRHVEVEWDKGVGKFLSFEVLH